ncbi:Uncharacterized protein TCM_027904 [Theobroma cacao]|uniref:Uncharacterized protein n=1 Tax=Theobroma cacao TaxID=3641 RepID=A0A061G9X0_THECC|nr:Uncharacterized protein TCM_027904 [Theobroma cacao]
MPTHFCSTSPMPTPLVWSLPRANPHLFHLTHVVEPLPCQAVPCGASLLLTLSCVDPLLCRVTSASLVPIQPPLPRSFQFETT